MRSVSAKSVILGVADLTGLDAANISDDDFAVIKRSISRRLAEAYEFALWPDLVRLDRRYFRALYEGGDTYSVPTTTAVSEVYFPQTGNYYQALRALPLTVSSITRSSNTATVTTSASHLLGTGDQVTISGATQTDYNITATITVTGATTFTYTVANTPATPATGTIKCTPDPADANDETQSVYWAESENEYTADTWKSGTTYDLGDTVYWPGTDRFYAYHNSTSSSGNQPGNATYWAILTEFDRYVAWAQSGETDLTGSTILNVYSANPRLTTRGKSLNFSLSSNGVQVHDVVAYCFVEYRQKPPQIKGEVWSATSTYTANVSQVYYDGAEQSPVTTTEGNFYDCIVNTTAGQDPDDTPASFSVVNIPYDFQRFLEHAGAADWFASEKEFEQSAVEEARAQAAIADQAGKLVGQSGQSPKTTVYTR